MPEHMANVPARMLPGPSAELLRMAPRKKAGLELLRGLRKKQARFAPTEQSYSQMIKINTKLETFKMAGTQAPTVEGESKRVKVVVQQ